MLAPLPFKPGSPAVSPGPLARYLPPLPDGIAQAWLSEHAQPGAWVLDPFGTSPRLAVEAARAGYRVLVAANNPVTRRLFEMAASPPPEAELRAALADLAAAYKGEERIEPHIRSLYLTECAGCGQIVDAEYFLWERGAKAPYARVYHCPACDDSGEKPSTPADVQRASQFAAGGMHRARALERIAPINDPDRAHAEEALAVYLPRAVYALFTLINRLDGLELSQARRSLLDAILLNAFDGANTLWPHPTLRERPRQLTIPPHFRENNVWLALEAGIERLASRSGKPVPLSTWPALPPAQGGISLFEGRLKDLAATLPEIEIGAVLAALPRPNQAFWTLSALWAGWLWGREAVGPFKSVLRRRRYDWAWHTTALSAAFGNLGSMLKPGVPLLGLIGEAEPGFLMAALISTESAEFDLEGLALRAGTGQVQILWRKAQPAGATGSAEGATTPHEDHETTKQMEALSPSTRPNARLIAAEAASSFLRERGQPAAYLQVHTAALSALACEHAFPSGLRTGQGEPAGSAAEPSPAESFSQVQSFMKETFTSRAGFLRYEGSEASLEVGQWWLSLTADKERFGAISDAQPAPATLAVPLADRIEIACVGLLQKQPGCTLAEIDTALCELFPGLHTPDPDLIHMCLDSYGEPIEPGSLAWRLRPEDKPAARRNDLETARMMIRQLGEQLGFTVVRAQEPAGDASSTTGTSIPYLWQETGGQIRYAFYIIVSSAFGEFVLRGSTPPEQSLILLPGGRANLAAYKLRCDPHLKQEIEKGWRFIKYRHLRKLLEDQQLTRENLEEQLGLDPLAYSATQIRLL